ncbi:MAG: hypothetical protein Q7W02_22050 [Candidatus Rokubacteria bacterium]|nr:hypothetical protein [Candidatus Rokubacteria bacterium]
MMQKGFFMLLAILVVSTALAAPDTKGTSERMPGSVTVETLCANAQADATYFIPEAFTEHSLRSISGKHGYRTSPNCPFWVADFSMNSKSNTFVDPRTNQRIKQRTQFYGRAHDLPSSPSADGTMPVVDEDCKRYTVEYIVYRKFKHEANFVLQKHVTSQGSVLGGGCIQQPKPDLASYKTEAPDANVLVIRVATRVKLRTSWQETAARADDAPLE